MTAKRTKVLEPAAPAKKTAAAKKAPAKTPAPAPVPVPPSPASAPAAAPAKKKPPRAGMGRPKGVPNKVTRALKDMILGALDDAGGQAYLTKCAMDSKTSAAFLTLLGKVLPSDLRVSDPDGKPLTAAPVFNVTLAASTIPTK